MILLINYHYTLFSASIIVKIFDRYKYLHNRFFAADISWPFAGFQGFFVHGGFYFLNYAYPFLFN